ncbi:MAG TPA: hypothetical protein VM639_09975 [Dongiaceae bacterium]|nr:hypothetical protein [Dongiaceae bacterium]
MAEHESPRLNPTKARAGLISGRVITILIASFILAVVLVGGATLYWTSSH